VAGIDIARHLPGCERGRGHRKLIHRQLVGEVDGCGARRRSNTSGPAPPKGKGGRIHLFWPPQEGPRQGAGLLGARRTVGGRAEVFFFREGGCSTTVGFFGAGRKGTKGRPPP